MFSYRIYTLNSVHQYTVCGKTKVTEVRALLFRKVFMATKYLFIPYISLAYYTWVLGFVLTITFLTTEEKVFIVEHYFRSYEVGRQNGPRLRHVRELYEEQFYKTAPSNKTILAIVEKFHRTRSVLCQRKGTTGHPRTVTANLCSSACPTI